MKYAEDGARIGDLRNILARIAEVACLFDTDGISIRAINRRKTGHSTHESTAAMCCQRKRIYLHWLFFGCLRFSCDVRRSKRC